MGMRVSLVKTGDGSWPPWFYFPAITHWFGEGCPDTAADGGQTAPSDFGLINEPTVRFYLTMLGTICQSK
jgi:hypothetical protein